MTVVAVGRPDPYTVPCPACHAPVDEPCSYSAGRELWALPGDGRSAKWVHPERVSGAKPGAVSWWGDTAPTSAERPAPPESHEREAPRPGPGTPSAPPCPLLDAYQRGNRDGLLSFAAGLERLAETYMDEVIALEKRRPRTPSGVYGVEQATRHSRYMASSCREFAQRARVAAEALPLDPEADPTAVPR